MCGRTACRPFQEGRPCPAGRPCKADEASAKSERGRAGCALLSFGLAQRVCVARENSHPGHAAHAAHTAHTRRPAHACAGAHGSAGQACAAHSEARRSGRRAEQSREDGALTSHPARRHAHPRRHSAHARLANSGSQQCSRDDEHNGRANAKPRCLMVLECQSMGRDFTPFPLRVNNDDVETSCIAVGNTPHAVSRVPPGRPAPPPLALSCTGRSSSPASGAEDAGG
eukprot:COSAG04_NODE_130_length_24323_cov_50.932835_13_plen_227_part_00